MILHDDTDTEYCAHFFHGRHVRAGTGVPQYTQATLHRWPCERQERPCGTSWAVEGTAWCSPNDNFERSVGRKIALGRALHALGLSYERRKAIWDSYFERVGKP